MCMIIFYLELITKILLVGEYQNICVCGPSPSQRSRLVDLYDQDSGSDDKESGKRPGRLTDERRE